MRPTGSGGPPAGPLRPVHAAPRAPALPPNVGMPALTHARGLTRYPVRTSAQVTSFMWVSQTGGRQRPRWVTDDESKPLHERGWCQPPHRPPKNSRRALHSQPGSCAGRSPVVGNTLETAQKRNRPFRILESGDVPLARGSPPRRHTRYWLTPICVHGASIGSDTTNTDQHGRASTPMERWQDPAPPMPRAALPASTPASAPSARRTRASAR